MAITSPESASAGHGGLMTAPLHAANTTACSSAQRIHTLPWSERDYTRRNTVSGNLGQRDLGDFHPTARARAFGHDSDACVPSPSPFHVGQRGCTGLLVIIHPARPIQGGIPGPLWGCLSVPLLPAIETSPAKIAFWPSIQLPSARGWIQVLTLENRDRIFGCGVGTRFLIFLCFFLTLLALLRSVPQARLILSCAPAARCTVPAPGAIVLYAEIRLAGQSSLDCLGDPDLLPPISAARAKVTPSQPTTNPSALPPSASRLV